MKIIYRRGIAEDLEAITKFIDEFLPDYFMPKSKIDTILTGGHGKRWSNKPSVVWVAYHKEKLVGIAFMSNIGTLWNLLVHPSYRKHGIGSSLLERCKPKKIRVKWDVSTGNPTSFYKRLGYGEMGVAIYGRDGEFGKKTQKKSIQMMIKNGKVLPLDSYESA